MNNPLINELRTIFPGNSRVYIIVRYVSRSKLTRHLSILRIYADENGRIYTEQWDSKVAEGLGLRRHAGPFHEGIVVSGGGMDIAAWLVRELSLALYSNPTALSFHVL